MPVNVAEHKCTLETLHWSEVPIEDPDNVHLVSFKVTCRICCKEWHEVYTKNEGLWDPEKEEYVPYPPRGNYEKR